MTTKARSSQLAAVNPLSSGSEDDKDSRITRYAQDRDYADRDTTSRLRLVLMSINQHLSSNDVSVHTCRLE